MKGLCATRFSWGRKAGTNRHKHPASRCIRRVYSHFYYLSHLTKTALIRIIQGNKAGNATTVKPRLSLKGSRAATTPALNAPPTCTAALTVDFMIPPPTTSAASRKRTGSKKKRWLIFATTLRLQVKSVSNLLKKTKR